MTLLHGNGIIRPVRKKRTRNDIQESPRTSLLSRRSGLFHVRGGARRPTRGRDTVQRRLVDLPERTVWDGNRQGTLLPPRLHHARRARASNRALVDRRLGLRPRGRQENQRLGENGGNARGPHGHARETRTPRARRGGEEPRRHGRRVPLHHPRIRQRGERHGLHLGEMAVCHERAERLGRARIRRHRLATRAEARRHLLAALVQPRRHGVARAPLGERAPRRHPRGARGPRGEGARGDRTRDETRLPHRVRERQTIFRYRRAALRDNLLQLLRAMARRQLQATTADRALPRRGYAHLRNRRAYAARVATGRFHRLRGRRGEDPFRVVDRPGSPLPVLH